MLKIYPRNLVIITIVLFAILKNFNSFTCDENCQLILQQATLRPPELIALSGYHAETHTVKTSDGYKLTVYRIPYGKKVSIGGGIPVLLMHGLMGNSGTWIDNLDQSLGFILADEGFDVWMGNIRGNECSEHLLYTKDKPEFWDYTVGDMAEYDLPAIIDYIRNVSKYKKILYVGFSLSSAMGFILFSSHPEYNEKVAGFIALGPVLNFYYPTDFVISTILRHIDKLQVYFKANGISRFNLWPNWFKSYVPSLCAYTSVCAFLSILTAGYGSDLTNLSRVPIYVAHASESTSVKNMIYFNQIRNGHLVKFDYGREENVNRYGSVNPPEYNKSNIVIPIVLFSSPNDPLATSLNVELGKRMLKSVIAHEIIHEPMFKHVNFYMSKSMRFLLADKMLFYMRNMWDRNGLT